MVPMIWGPKISFGLGQAVEFLEKNENSNRLCMHTDLTILTLQTIEQII